MSKSFSVQGHQQAGRYRKFTQKIIYVLQKKLYSIFQKKFCFKFLNTSDFELSEKIFSTKLHILIKFCYNEWALRHTLEYKSELVRNTLQRKFRIKAKNNFMPHNVCTFWCFKDEGLSVEGINELFFTFFYVVWLYTSSSFFIFIYTFHYILVSIVANFYI